MSECQEESSKMQVSDTRRPMLDRTDLESGTTIRLMQLNSKFVNNMLPEWSRFITEVKLNREQNYDLESLTNSLALLTSIIQSHLPQTNNQLESSSNARNQGYGSNGESCVSRYREDTMQQITMKDPFQRNNARRKWCGGKCRSSEHRSMIILVKCETHQELQTGNEDLGAHKHVIFRACQSDFKIRHTVKDKMLLMQAQENEAVLDEEQSLLFLQGNMVTVSARFCGSIGRENCVVGMIKAERGGREWRRTIGSWSDMGDRTKRQSDGCADLDAWLMGVYAEDSFHCRGRVQTVILIATTGQRVRGARWGSRYWNKRELCIEERNERRGSIKQQQYKGRVVYVMLLVANTIVSGERHKAGESAFSLPSVGSGRDNLLDI
ncbi:hypothetical protein Tco_0008406 [Tanacetum coccineum]